MANEENKDIQKRIQALEEIIESSKKMQEKAQRTLDELRKEPMPNRKPKTKKRGNNPLPIKALLRFAAVPTSPL
jgi:hypothetical protein